MPKFDANEDGQARRPAKRSERRFAVEQPVRLSVPGAGVGPCGGTMRDVSGRGMQVSAPHELWLGALVRIEWTGRVLMGFVRHQREHDGLYWVGVELLTPDETLAADVLAQQVADLRMQNRELAARVGGMAGCGKTILGRR